ncbi:glycosylated lysosomal membrane protein isoform X2 [Rousettus aegyptiacus]|uniref:glycosylated lysosomal membrane protein isoform X2 n=1 Tax=Rousettus aegyptiacus TaxID=9407 RepID=UPI00168CEC54|nr:glycosylated lysosomal membrane protein isoform X2 [Rousettus aegyptiacus]
MGSREGPCWGWGCCAPGPVLLLSLLWAAPSALLGEETRQVSLEVVSDWGGPPENLLHIRAVGTNSTLHYVWGTVGPPAVLLVATDTPHSVLSVNWSLLLSSEPYGGLTVLPKDSIQFSSALVFTRLFEFDGTNASDTAAQPPGRPYPPYSLAEFSWSNVSGSVDPATLSATFQGHPTGDPTGAFANGSLAFRVQAFPRSGRPAQPPRLLHTADTCQLEVALSGASPRGNRSLFGLEVATLGPGPACPSLQGQHSIDDEYAPAVFQVGAPGCGSASSGCLVPTGPRHHGGGPGCSGPPAAGRGPVSAAGPQGVLRISAHQLRPALEREGHYYTCLAGPRTSASLSICVPGQLLPSRFFAEPWGAASSPGGHRVRLPSYSGRGRGTGLLLVGGCVDLPPCSLGPRVHHARAGTQGPLTGRLPRATK